MSKETLGADVDKNLYERFNDACEELGLETKSDGVRKFLDEGIRAVRERELRADGGTPHTALGILAEKATGVSLTGALLAFVLSYQQPVYLKPAGFLAIAAVVFATVYGFEVGFDALTNRFTPGGNQ